MQNPFDFSNPVTERSVLAGRGPEMQQASYYLDQSREGASYSLALVGERASGKTSLLNALADYANETGLIAANVRLDEGVAGDDLDFFREVFHSLMEACARRGVFGGEAGAEYDTFCRQILTHDLETSRAEEPLAFGRVYATARSQGRPIALSRRMLLADLAVIVDRCGAAGFPAVVLLIDEGDVLAGNHALLQTIRNLLMDSSHFSLIAAGTEKMFPAISEVFSPVPRQFVRINVGPFGSWEDTRKAILRRLVLAGQEWAMPNVERCREIHSLTRGSPYEVMLVSHFAYRDLTTIRQRVPMSVTPEVIGAVADQLEQQNPSVQETMSKLRELDKADAETIRELIDLDGLSINRFALARMDFSQPFREEALSDESERVLEILDRLGQSGFVSIVDGSLRVDADSFQRALIKYVVLGHRDSDAAAKPLLTDPRRQIAHKAIGAMRVALETELGKKNTEDLIMEVHRDNSTMSLTLALDDKYAVEDYPVQATCRVIVDSQWTGVFVFKREHDSAGFREEISELLSLEATRLSEFDLEVSEIEVGEVNPEKMRAFRGTLGEVDDPIEDLVDDAREAFREGRRDFPERVARACSALLENDPAEDEERWQQVNDCAFMALGAEDSDSYKLLSDRAEALKEPRIMSKVTRALWEATEGRYEEAIQRLEIEAEVIAAVPEEFRQEMLMYSPALLAAEMPSISHNDLVGGVELAEVIRGYRVAMQARMGSLSIADALGEFDDLAPWLLGAAADAAAIEGRAELETELRRRAAKSAEPDDENKENSEKEK
jgi:hypothetical protein